MGIGKLIDLSAAEPAQTWDNLEQPRPHREIMIGSSPVCRDPGNEAPVIDEAGHAALIISGCTATWLGTFWKVVHTKSGKFTHVSKNAGFEEWKSCLIRIGDQGFGGQ